MSITEQNINKKEAARNIPLIVAAVIGVLILGGLFFYMRSRPAPTPYTGPANQRLEGALRAGSPEFEAVKQKIGMDDPVADERTRMAGGLLMTLHTTARNFTGRTISGLEMRAAVVDLAGKPIKERYVIVVPSAAKNVTELENNKTLPVSVVMEGFSKEDVRANIQMEVTGVTFK